MGGLNAGSRLRSGKWRDDQLHRLSMKNVRHAFAATWIACRVHFVVQPDGRQLGKGGQPRRDDRVIGHELDRAGRVLPRRGRGEIAGHLPGRDPVMHPPAADAESLGDGCFREAILEKMLK